MSTNSPPSIDKVAAARWRVSAPQTTPWLHEEIATRMLERLQWITAQPKVWVNWNANRGGEQAHAALLAKYKESESYIQNWHIAGESIAYGAIKCVA